MNPTVVDDLIFRLTTGWGKAVIPRALIGLIGVLILAFIVRSIWKRDWSVFGAVLWLIAGGVFLTFSFFPQQIIHFVVSTEYMTRIRLLMGGVSVLVLLITLESIRRTHLQERYALLWVATALVLLACVLFPHAVDLLRAVTGMEYATAIAAVAFTFLVLVAFHFSISMSAMQSKQSKVAQKLAILEARVRELEQNAENRPFGTAQDRQTVGDEAENREPVAKPYEQS